MICSIYFYKNQVIWFPQQGFLSFPVFMLAFPASAREVIEIKRERREGEGGERRKKNKWSSNKILNWTINQTCNDPFEHTIPESFLLMLIQYFYQLASLFTSFSSFLFLRSYYVIFVPFVSCTTAKNGETPHMCENMCKQ